MIMSFLGWGHTTVSRHHPSAPSGGRKTKVEKAPEGSHRILWDPLGAATFYDAAAAALPIYFRFSAPEKSRTTEAKDGSVAPALGPNFCED